MVRTNIIIPISFILFILTDSCEPPINSAPKIESFTFETNEVLSGEELHFECVARDEEGDQIYYKWSVTSTLPYSGSFNSTSSANVIWYAPTNTRVEEPLYELCWVQVEVTDDMNRNEPDSRRLMIFVYPANHCKVDGTARVILNNNTGEIIQVYIRSGIFSSETRKMDIGNSTTFNFIPAGEITIWRKNSSNVWKSWTKFIEKCETQGYSFSK